MANKKIRVPKEYYDTYIEAVKMIEEAKKVVKKIEEGKEVTPEDVKTMFGAVFAEQLLNTLNNMKRTNKIPIILIPTIKKGGIIHGKDFKKI